MDELIKHTPDQIVDELDANEAIPKNKAWKYSEGWNAAIVVDKKGDELVFQPSKGIVMKVFVNTKTGEVKMYWAKYITDSPIR